MGVILGVKINRRKFCRIAASSLVASQSRRVFGAFARQGISNSETRNEFIIRNPIGSPFYAWPRTLLSFPVRADISVDSMSHRLFCTETNKPVTFQPAKPAGIISADSASELIFFSDLPAGATQTYRLEALKYRSHDLAQRSIKITHDALLYTIDAGPIQIRIPSSQTVTGDAPGPILQLSHGGKWTGSSRVTVPGHPIASILTEQLEDGPLRSTHRITYTFTSGANYIATIQCFVDTDFIRLHENMEAISEEMQGEFRFAWNGCDFTYRQAPNHPYSFPATPQPRYDAYPWEAIAPTYMDTQFGVSEGLEPDGRMPFSLRIFDPWQDLAAASFANFWEDHGSDAVAIFIDHIEQWDDYEYSIWRSSCRIAVEFIYTNQTLHFVWKIARGSRSTCVSFYNHENDIKAMAKIERVYKGVEAEASSFRTGVFPASYALELQNWYGTLDLNKTKDWILSYPKHAAIPKPLFKLTEWKNAEAFYQTVVSSNFLTQLALSGVRQNHGVGPTSSRQFLEGWVPSYQIFRSQLNHTQRERIDAILLLLAYLHAGEDYMPMKHMLAGHPNFLSDVKSTPCGMSFLFPDHPAADTWADEWEAYLRLNTRYHTRPAVNTWNARGGRWTENLGTYVWAFLKPAARASFLLKMRDGYERLCTPQIVSLSDWLVNALSAPFDGETPAVMKQIEIESAQHEGARRHYWGIVSPADGPRRVHPPIGAHSDRRKTPRLMWYMGTVLRRYSPLTAESLMWAARPTDQDMEATADAVDSYHEMFNQPDNRGTNPHLRTAKYTGYGITLRTCVDTPQELSIHLIQIDDGPNYRWGNAGEGACGVIYFYANGKGYSHNGAEDAGDRIDQDTDFCSNFGVWKGNTFRSIGQNVLSRPFYDLTYAQYAEIVSRKGADAYSWPEYVGRSILLAGDDYFIVHDKVFNAQVAHRFSWFVRKGDSFPHITLLNTSNQSDGNHFSSVETESTSGLWTDGSGDSIALITHKEGIRAERAPFGGRITLPEGNDLLFASQEPVHFQEDGCAFTGTSGIIRKRKDSWEIVLFHGTYIAASEVSFSTNDTELGISASISKLGSSGVAMGYFCAPATSQATVRFTKPLQEVFLYIDGTRTKSTRSNNWIDIKLPAGLHRWELTASLPVPLSPSVLRTEYSNGGAIVYGTIVGGASSYQAEISDDEAHTWRHIGEATTPQFTLAGLTNSKKYHVRLIAKNKHYLSDPGSEYPLYITRQSPPSPDGLHVKLSTGAANLTWGEVLGVTEYRLFRRKSGEENFSIVYRGLDTQWTDTSKSILQSSTPVCNRVCVSQAADICEYYVTANNHNGESLPSRRANTDPTSWRNWNPTGDEPFRRTQERNKGPLPNDGGGRYYPD